MKVSVIIPIYNVERFLVRCLDSVAAAARQFVEAEGGHAVEIICVDDGSTDNSPAILAEYVARQIKSPRLTFKVVTKPNGGQGSARNLGLDHITGDYVMFVDADDYILPYSILTFAAVAVESKASLVVSMSFLKDRGKRVSFPTFKTDYRRWKRHPSSWIAGKKVQYSVWNKFYRSDLLKKRRFSGEMRAFEDYPFITEIFCSLDSFAAIKMPLYVYCINPSVSSTIHSPFSESKLKDFLFGVRMILASAKGSTSWRFALRQASDGLSSAIGKVYKTKSDALARALDSAVSLLFADYPMLRASLSFKARLRFGKMKKRILSSAIK